MVLQRCSDCGRLSLGLIKTGSKLGTRYRCPDCYDKWAKKKYGRNVLQPNPYGV